MLFRKGISILALAIAFIFCAQSAFAELAAVAPVLPGDSNGFPDWYQDSNGLSIELGLDPVLNLFDPPIPGNNFSEQIGFGAEGFYWIAETSLDFPGGNIFYRAALEYAWVNELPADGDQFVFGRLRFRVDVPVAGTYRVTHPYGEDEFVADAPGPRAINVTIDVGGATPDFTTALTSRIGPFLTAVNPAPPAGFVGNGPVLSSTVTGSPFGTNFLRIRGPGGIDASTDQFTVSGKIFTGSVGTPLSVERATYQRVNPGSVDVFATSTPTSAVTVNGLTPLPMNMVGDGAGKFFRRVNVENSDILPPVVTVTADNSPANTPTSVIKELLDDVNITRAEYDVNSRILTIEANSGDQRLNPVLTAVGFGDLVDGSLSIPNVFVPPPTVTVRSAIGGQDTHSVSIVAIAPPPPNQLPVAADDIAFAFTAIPLDVNVVGNDTDADGTINPASVVIVSGPVSGGVVNNGNGTVTYTSNLGFAGLDSFTYTVQDDLGDTSNVATVNVTVNAPAANTPPVAVNDIANTNANIPVVINVIANDTDVDGNATINPASVVVTLPLNGSAVSNLDGTVTYTPNAGFSGADSFTYTIRDNLGALSNAATVNVTVNPGEILAVTSALFRQIGSRWVITGTDSLASPSVVITVSLERGGLLIGSGNVAADPLLPPNVWEVDVRRSSVLPQAGDTVRVQSSAGAELRNVPVTIRR